MKANKIINFIFCHPERSEGSISNRFFVDQMSPQNDVSRFTFHASRSSGFTLLELLLAISIIATVSALVATSLSRTFSVKTTIEKQEVLDHTMRVALSKLSDDISQAFLKEKGESPFIEFVGEDSGDFDSLRFNSFSHFRYIRDSKESDQNEITFLIEDSKTSNTKDLVRSEKFVIDDNHKELGEKFVLIPNITTFNIKYCDGKNQKWDTRWDTTLSDYTGRLPIAIEIKLKFKDEEEFEQEFKTFIILEWEIGKKTMGSYLVKGCKEEE